MYIPIRCMGWWERAVAKVVLTGNRKKGTYLYEKAGFDIVFSNDVNDSKLCFVETCVGKSRKGSG